MYSNFGDIRSVMNSALKGRKLREALAITFADYDGPWEPIRAYVPDELMPITWAGGDGKSTHVLRATDHYCQNPLSAVVRLAGRDEVIWHSDIPMMPIQRALLPIRHETVDKYWRPWASKHGNSEDFHAVDGFLSMLEAWIEGRATRSEAWHAKSGIFNSRLNVTPSTTLSCRLAWQAADAVARLEPWEFAWYVDEICPEPGELTRINERVSLTLLKL